MEGPISLSDQELSYYHNLFKGCDVDGSGKIPGFKALELFKAAGLTTDILAHISELCGAKRLGHYGRSQFFIALKLIVAAQNGLPVKLETINMAKQAALPQFTVSAKEDNTRTDSDLSSTGDGLKSHVPTGQLPPPPAKKHGRNSSGQWRGVVTQQSEPAFTPQTLNNNTVDGVHNEPRSPQFSPKQSPPLSPVTKPAPITKQQSSPAVISPNVKPNSTFIYTNVVNNEDHSGWANFDDDDGRGLLGSGHKKLSDHLDPHYTFDSSSISSETESLDDVWTINDEQRDYYVQQFKTMQIDLNGVITGHVAKEFFEKSNLPVQELSKIWQLSDVNKDGALSLEEFCTAMHLVVLRRNDIELPNDLPATLMPYSTLVEDEPFAANLPKGATIKRASPHSPADKQWVAPVRTDSPLASEPSTPAGVKPVNFEVKPPDPAIPHPVAKRMSPNSQLLAETAERCRSLSDPSGLDSPDGEGPELVSPSKPRAFTFCDSNMAATEPLHGRPRPKKSTDRGVLPVTSQGVDGSLPPPPQLPPRPSQHTRSVSMDLKLKTERDLYPPPIVPPRASPKDIQKQRFDQLQFTAVDSDRLIKPHSGNLKRFEPIPSQEVLTLTSPIEDHNRLQPTGVVNNLIDKHRRAVSLDYRQLGPMAGGTQTQHTISTYDNSDATGGSDPYLSADKLIEEPTLPAVEESPIAENDTQTHAQPVRQASRDRRDYQLAIRTHRECNTMLLQANSELNQELQEVMEQRIALEIQLEHLRPFYS